MKRTLLIFTAAVVLAGCGNQTSQPQNIQPVTVTGEQNVSVIAVSGKESVSVVPDIAEVVFAVTTQAADAKSCQDEATKHMNHLIDALKAAGIEEKSLQTSNYNLSTQNDWNNNGTIIGYEMTAQLTVKDIPLEQVGEVLSASVEAGANEVNSVSYLSSQYDVAYAEALGLAVEQAKTKAQALAEASGCTVGAVVNITEYSQNQEIRYRHAMVNGTAKMDAAPGGSMNMMAGELSIEANVSVEFAIQ